MMIGNKSPSDFKINTSTIPKDEADYIAMCTIREIKKFLSIPGNKEFLDRKTEERKKRLAAEKENTQ